MACRPKTPRKNTKINEIGKITSKLTRYKIKATVRIETDTEDKKYYKNKDGEGNKFVVFLKDESGSEIRGVAFGKIAEEIESEIENNKEYYISGFGADITVANKDYKRCHKYELKFQRKPLIEPVDGPSLSQDSGTGDAASSSSSSHRGTETAVRKRVQFEPVHVEEIHRKHKSSKTFDILGVVKNLSKADYRYDEESKFYKKDILLIDWTGEVTIGITSKKKKDLDILKGLEGQIVGVIGCKWKTRRDQKSILTEELKKLYLESQVPESSKSHVEKLKEWYNSNQKKASITPKVSTCAKECKETMEKKESNHEESDPSANACNLPSVNHEAKQRRGSSSPKSGTKPTIHETRGTKRSHEEKEDDSTECKSAHNSEEELQKWNFKMFKKLTKIGRDALQIYFDSVILPENLEKVLIDNKDTMEYGRYKMSEEQMQILFPAKKPPATSSKLDVTMMYKLLRNFASDLPSPTKGWGKKPELGNKEKTDDMERVRFYRNKVDHVTKDTNIMDNDDCEMFWKDLSQAILRLSDGKLQKDIMDLEAKARIPKSK
ncbi:uncharacterized protein LOC133178898 [Saccostrea echinata]|uniref:uncharacterized protein LOC133178898 n=1 Tax=Saccostrea echinata TaxID=191078 RepID=UPI002A7F18DD|nr:uncharacterized protein LOC133178898 [Saccostrea echinata]XP_061169545.1 uncharacterized protein LOC133178898 [Saccostrea echinata]XP_061169546.1 uncharacterized protein LOC133178898 [Saccostrea echinata]